MGRPEINPSVILTTSIDVAPEMPFVAERDKDKRLQQYQDTRKWWLDNTPYNLVVVENTGYDLALKDDDRIEFISFNANKLEIIERGKGFAEGIALVEAYKKSAFLRGTKTHIKCSGRYIVKNIIEIVDDFCEKEVLATVHPTAAVCYVYRPEFFFYYLLKNLPMIDDRFTRWIEKAVSNAATAAKNVQLWHFDCEGVL